VGMAIDGKIFRTAYECMGDAGHVIIDPHGPRCSAGCHGCAEVLVSAAALESRFERLSGNMTSVREIIELAQAGDRIARLAVEETGHLLGLAMASLATIFFPDRIVVSGGISEAGELLIASAVKSFQATGAPFCTQHVAVRQAKLGWRATVAGAAAALMV
jgi:N-acetylglucosamine repressor